MIGDSFDRAVAIALVVAQRGGAHVSSLFKIAAFAYFVLSDSGCSGCGSQAGPGAVPQDAAGDTPADVQHEEASNATDLGPSACDPRVTAPAQPLGEVPRILWTAPIDAAGGSASARAPVAVLGDRIALSRGSQMFVYSRQGKVVAARPVQMFLETAAPVANDDGFYFAGEWSYGLTKDGAVIWERPLRRDSRGPTPNPFTLGPGGILYSAQPDGQVQALRVTTGETVWAVNSASGRPNIVSGVGDALILSDGGMASYRTRDGVASGLASAVGPIAYAAGFGIVGIAREREAVYSTRIFDLAGSLRWVSAAIWTTSPIFVDLAGRLVLAERPDASGDSAPTRLQAYTCGGVPDGGPVVVQAVNPALVSFQALGADGTAYFVSGTLSSSPPKFELIAIDTTKSFIRAWTLDLGDGSVDLRSGALADDGVLYLVMSAPVTDAGILVAIQTTSPGLASTSWPALRYDARSSGWAR